MAINRIFVTSLASFMLFFSASIKAQEITGLPGDHFNLEGVLEIFAESESMEDFEKRINAEDQFVNNLDLNQDGEVDYIRVEDYASDDLHAIVMQAVLGPDEVQDIAVIEIEKSEPSAAILQIVGDQDIYGENIIVEPFDEADQSKGGPSFDKRLKLVVNVWVWPSVRSVFRPGYRPWISPWKWRHYPRWWRPWSVHPVDWFFHRRVIRHPFHRVATHRLVRTHQFYSPKRKISVSVQGRHQKSVAEYRSTRGITQTSHTKVMTGPNGGKAAITKSRTIGTVNSPRGKAIGTSKKTTVNVQKPDGDKAKHTRKTTNSVTRSKKGTVTTRSAQRRSSIRKNG